MRLTFKWKVRFIIYLENTEVISQSSNILVHETDESIEYTLSGSGTVNIEGHSYIYGICSGKKAKWKIEQTLYEASEQKIRTIVNEKIQTILDKYDQ